MEENTDAAAPAVKEEETEETSAAPVEEVKPTVAKAKPTQAKRKGRKAVKKKPDDMPRRPLSAYNFFFSEMRSKLLADRAAGNESDFQKFLEERQEQDGEKKNGFFSNMGKFVAKRWKELTADELQPYTEKAEKDLQRYRKEMDEYREGVARKTRLASEQKLREQEAEAAKAPQMGPGGQQPWMMGGNPMMGFQNTMDPSFQLLLRQQLLQGQNPQLNAFLLQQQFGGFPGAMGQFQQPGMQPNQGGGDMSNQGGGQQQFDMQQQQPSQQDLLNNLQQQQRMPGMYPGMMQGQPFMPMGMMQGGGMPDGMDGQQSSQGGPQQSMQNPLQMAQGGQMPPQGGGSSAGGSAGGQW